MSSLDSTKEALSIVDKLKLCILKQDQLIRGKNTEVAALRDTVSDLEKEREELKREILKLKGVDNKVLDCAGDELEIAKSSLKSQSTPNVAITTSSSPAITITSEKFTTLPISSPSKGSLKGISKTREASVKRNDSITRTKSFSKKYELSPDLQERSLMLLERKYGGKEKAHNAAKIIQTHYRKYAMDKRFRRIRAYSETPDRLLRDKAPSDPPQLNVMPGCQTTPVLRLVKKTVQDRNKRVCSTLIIDNITPCHAAAPTNLEKQFESAKSNKNAHELKPAASGENKTDDRLDVEDDRQSISITEHYVKVEMVEQLENSPDVFAPDKQHVANGDVKRSRKSTTGGESDESFGEEYKSGSHQVSGVDSLDGVCMSLSRLDADLDTISVTSEYDPIPAHSLKPQKLEMRIGINHFNRKPEKGIDYLISHQVLEDNPEVVAKFLITEHGISKQRLGEYLGNLQIDFNMAVLKCFTENLNFTDMEIDVALRSFLSKFRIPGEAQKIERLMEMFSEQYIHCNPTDDESAQDKVLILAFAIVMLNTDLHSPNVKKRMTENDFKRNLEGVNNGGNFPEDSLSAIYRRIHKREFNPARDHVTMTMKLEKKIIGKMPWTTLAAIHRYLRMMTQLFEVQDPHKRDKVHGRVLFLFNDLLVVTKERGKPGQREGFHFYSYKYSFPLGGVKISLFENDYYLYGIQLYSRIQSKVLGTFNAADEQTRKVIVEELMECIDETDSMENDRISTEKQKQMSCRLERNQGTMTLPHPKKNRGKSTQSGDTISLLNVSMTSFKSLSNENLMNSKQLSNSMLNISDGDISFSSDMDGFKRCNSSSSLDSAFVDGDSSRPNNASPLSSTMASSSPKIGLFRKWRVRNTKSLNKGTPSPSATPSPHLSARKTSSTSS